jgi:hypothetical protein
MPIKYKAINGATGNTTVYLDSANNLKEAKFAMSHLEASENWCLKLYNPEKRNHNERINVNN